MLNVQIITAMPGWFPGILGESLAGRALEQGLWALDVLDLRGFASDPHRTIDDRPFGGGAGMVLKPDIAGAAIEEARKRAPHGRLICPSPRGALFSQTMAEKWSREESLCFLCGRFEGIDQRVLDHYPVEEVSLGDYILSGGEIAAQVMLDACIRLLPGVVNDPLTHAEESVSPGGALEGLLEYPHYTRPLRWEAKEVPAVLCSGNHRDIANWRREQAEGLTRRRRPDLWRRYGEREKE